MGGVYLPVPLQGCLDMTYLAREIGADMVCVPTKWKYLKMHVPLFFFLPCHVMERLEACVKHHFIFQ